jgi:hypothetical protein
MPAGKMVLHGDGKIGVLSSGAVAVYDADGNCPECCFDPCSEFDGLGLCPVTVSLCAGVGDLCEMVCDQDWIACDTGATGDCLHTWICYGAEGQFIVYLAYLYADTVFMGEYIVADGWYVFAEADNEVDKEFWCYMDEDYDAIPITPTVDELNDCILIGTLLLTNYDGTTSIGCGSLEITQE